MNEEVVCDRGWSPAVTQMIFRRATRKSFKGSGRAGTLSWQAALGKILPDLKFEDCPLHSVASSGR